MSRLALGLAVATGESVDSARQDKVGIRDAKHAETHHGSLETLASLLCASHRDRPFLAFDNNVNREMVSTESPMCLVCSSLKTVAQACRQGIMTVSLTSRFNEKKNTINSIWR